MAALFQAPVRDLLLVGGGHTHVQVLRNFAMKPPADGRLTVVLDTPVAVYSGMVPGLVAGQYRPDELEIDVLPLARRAGARVVLSAAVGLDVEAQRLELEDRPSLPYDLISFDIGSTVAGLDVPGVRRYALPTRPIRTLVDRVDEIQRRAEQAPRDRPFTVVVVGGGAGGVELAFTLRRRLSSVPGLDLEILLLEAGPRILPRYPAGLVRRVERQASRLGVRLLCDRQVSAAEAGALQLGDGERLRCSALVWVTGATAHPVLARSGLATDDRGFLRVRATLQAESRDEIFAVGDCATLVEFPQTPKAGVYAVRQGPYLIHNLRAAIAGRALRRYRPQSDFLTLLNLGNDTALGSKWGVSFEGPWVWRLKDWIDRRFMRRFQVLDAGGGLREEFARLPAMDGGEQMVCGGCAAKVGQSVLTRALERLAADGLPGESNAAHGANSSQVLLGLGEADDAVAYTTPSGDVVVSSIDAFRAFTDDPYLVGRVAAVNAASDVQAKGVRPRYALALVTVPDELTEAPAEETLFQVLAGARDAFEPLQVQLLGGHTTTGPDLVVGFVVEGLARGAADLLRLSGLRAGDDLVLSKGLGTGVLFHADMQGRAAGAWLGAAIASMLTPNQTAAELAREHGASAVTDVTGFGLAGHLGAMLRASGCSAKLETATLPALPGAVELLAQGLRSTFHPENARAARGMRIEAEAADAPRTALLFDPQTSGGLLVGVSPSRSQSLVAAWRQAGYGAARKVGRVTAAGEEGPLITAVVGGGEGRGEC